MLCSCFLSSRRRHTRCALVTGVQTCALPIFDPDRWHLWGGYLRPRDKFLLGKIANLLAVSRVHSAPKNNEVVFGKHLDFLREHQRPKLIGLRGRATSPTHAPNPPNLQPTPPTPASPQPPCPVPPPPTPRPPPTTQPH